MKKKTLILMAVAAIVCIGILIINACSKSDLPNNERVHFSSTDILEMNNYKPDKESIRDLYRSFRNEIKAMKEAEFKSTIDPIDREITEAVWLLDATTNTELGFKNDSIEELFEDTLKIIFTNKSFNPEGIPVIDGDEIVAAYLQFENKVIQNLIYNNLLWAAKAEISEITEETTEVNLILVEGPKGVTGKILPFPPGVDPQAFPAGTSWNMSEGAARYYGQIKAPGRFWPGPNYIWYYQYPQAQDWYDDGPGYHDDRVAHSTGTCETGIISGSLVNYYLFGEKEVIDENNPNGFNGYFIGYFEIYCLNFPDPIGTINSQHVLYEEIYESVYIGDPQ